ncbi:MAG: dihydrofolate reductase [Steroidobacteraceae bacterium]
MADNGVIGRGNALPWHLSDDLKRFKRLTIGHTVLMGRRTFESIARPLPDRLNFVLTHDPHWTAAGCVAVGSPEEALAAVGDSRRLFVIGGAQVYLACWRFVNHLELTEVHTAIDGDTRLQGFDRNAWIETFREEHDADARHAHAFSFVTLKRR